MVEDVLELEEGLDVMVVALRMVMVALRRAMVTMMLLLTNLKFFHFAFTSLRAFPWGTQCTFLL